VSFGREVVRGTTFSGNLQETNFKCAGRKRVHFVILKECVGITNANLLPHRMLV
jgi:hypothetical protein